MGRPSNQERAETFIDQIKSMLNGLDGVIYGVESEIQRPNVISPRTAGMRDAYIEVTLYNIGNPENVFPASKWVRLGEIGADVDLHSSCRWNDYNPTIEFHKRF